MKCTRETRVSRSLIENSDHHFLIFQEPESTEAHVPWMGLRQPEALSRLRRKNDIKWQRRWPIKTAVKLGKDHILGLDCLMYSLSTDSTTEKLRIGRKMEVQRLWRNYFCGPIREGQVHHYETGCNVHGKNLALPDHFTVFTSLR